jgi:DNA polymerase-3 subunit delta
VKGLPRTGWPRDSWQALRQLAMQLAQAGNH